MTFSVKDGLGFRPEKQEFSMWQCNVIFYIWNNLLNRHNPEKAHFSNAKMCIDSCTLIIWTVPHVKRWDIFHANQLQLNAIQIERKISILTQDQTLKMKDKHKVKAFCYFTKSEIDLPWPIVVRVYLYLEHYTATSSASRNNKFKLDKTWSRTQTGNKQKTNKQSYDDLVISRGKQFMPESRNKWK